MVDLIQINTPIPLAIWIRDESLLNDIETEDSLKIYIDKLLELKEIFLLNPDDKIIESRIRDIMIEFDIFLYGAESNEIDANEFVTMSIKTLKDIIDQLGRSDLHQFRYLTKSVNIQYILLEKMNFDYDNNIITTGETWTSN